MSEITQIFISVIVPIATSIISYKMAVTQSVIELEKTKTQYNIELQKVREQSQVELQKSQNELEKIKLESEKEIKKIQTELDKQADLYSKNSETDMTNKFMEQFMTQIFSDPNALIEQLKFMNEISKIGEEKNIKNK